MAKIQIFVNHTLCHACLKPTPILKLTKLSFRYQDKLRKYKSSGRAIIHTGYSYLCPKCLKIRTK